MKNITQSLKVVVLALVLSIGISYVSAWTAPTATPPGGNVAAPLNTGNNMQYKTGALVLNDNSTNPFINGLLVLNGKVGIGMSAPTEKLDVVGNIKASGDICSNGGTKCLSTMSNGVTSLTAGSGITLSGSTGAVTVSSTGGGTGLLAALRGKTISCTGCSTAGAGCQYQVTMWASVDNSGNPSTRIRVVPPNAGYTIDSGTVAGFDATISSVYLESFSAHWNFGTAPSLTGDKSACSANWPLN